MSSEIAAAVREDVAEKVRLLAFYLPQFHPIAENDKWWGKGFTEWTNVAKAKPLFRDHYQPHVPADLGPYDLRLGETREAQAELARAYGIEGFCYYHYWFEGRRLIERPFHEVLHTGHPDFPFCLTWANETWSRRWLGEERDVLMEQTYSERDDLDHVRWLMQAFADPRYVRVHGRPLFQIYRPTHLPEPRRTTDIFRNECVKAGLPEPYLVGMDAHHRGLDYRAMGFDSTTCFAPNLGLLPGAFNDRFSKRRLLRNMQRWRVASGRLKLYGYDEVWRAVFDKRPAFPHYPTVFVGWDNSPRRGEKGFIIPDSAPEKFEAAMREALVGVRTREPEERILFVNAWNEWAEGNYLEPDLRHGRAFLEAIKRAVDG